MPVSSAAADSLKLASGRTSVNLGGSRTGPVKWLLALNACPAKMAGEPFLRSDNRDMVEFLGGRGRYFSYADAVEKAGLLRGSLRGNSHQAHAAEAVLGALAVYEQAGVALALRLEGTSGCLGTLDAWHEAMVEASAELEAAEREKRHPSLDRLYRANRYFQFLQTLVQVEEADPNVALRVIPHEGSYLTPAAALLEKNLSPAGRTALKAYAAAKGCTLYDALLANLETESFRRSRAKDYARLIEKYRAIFDNMDLTDLLAGVLHDSGYETMLRSAGEEERLDNLAELKQAIFDFTRKAGETVTLGNYLDHAALFTNMDTGEKAQAVKLMTIHSAKGLEFPVVFLCGLSEGIFPGKRANTREKLEEERRLCYVAFTRARDRLFLSDAAGTGYDGAFRYPSRFLFNAEKENVDYAVPLEPGLEEKTRSIVRETEDLGEQQSVPADVVGKRVRHPAFGQGTVIGVPREGQGLIVQFDAVVTPRTFADAGKVTFE